VGEGFLGEQSGELLDKCQRLRYLLGRRLVRKSNREYSMHCAGSYGVIEVELLPPHFLAVMMRESCCFLGSESAMIA
jgi:hypothetical protein